MKAETALVKLIKMYGVRRAMTLFGAASLVAVRGWDVLVGDDAYSRQGAWTWKRDLEAGKVDPFEVEWDDFARKVGTKMGDLAVAGTAARKRKASRKPGRSKAHGDAGSAT